MPAVLSTAALATQLGDAATGQDLAGRWDRIRLRLGLPAPIGYAEPLAHLALDPASPAGPRSAHVWREEPLHDLIADAHHWCAAA